jgi:hypothetical protein
MGPQERVNRSKKEIFLNNFIGGIAWALGATVGIAIIGFLITKIDLVPIVGDFITEVNQYILQQNPQFLR